MNSKRICAALSVFAISVFSQQLTPGYAAQTTSQRASSGASRVPARVPGVLPVRNQSHSLTQLPSAGGMHGAGPWKTSKSQLRSIAGKAADSNAILSQASPSPFYSGTNYAGITHTNDIDPPDPTMAAGPNNLVIATNTGVQWIAKTGSSRSTLQSISTFFSPLGQVANDITTDPWTVYDPYINRFWVLATSFSNNPNRSTLLFAISSSSDANQGWNFFSFDATLNGSTQANIACDRPTLGFDAQAIYVTCDMYTFPLNSSSPFQYAKIWVITKSQFINNGPTVYYWSFW
jgi:hypothetical protein